MSFTSKEKTRTSGVAAPLRRGEPWSRLARPIHSKAVHRFRDAAESADGVRLASLLDPGVAVVVDPGDSEHPTIRVVRGVYEAIALLQHGMAVQPGLVIDECAVSGQAGLMLNRDGQATAAITIDFAGRLISVVWIRLHPVKLRHWNEV